MCVSVCMCIGKYPMKTEGAMGTLGTGVDALLCHPIWVLGFKLRSSERVVSDPKCQAISPAPGSIFLKDGLSILPWIEFPPIPDLAEFFVPRSFVPRYGIEAFSIFSLNINFC